MSFPHTHAARCAAIRGAVAIAVLTVVACESPSNPTTDQFLLRASAVSGSPTFDLGIDFRQTAGYVTDPANATYDLGAAYPVIQNGATFGWTSPNQTSAARNRNTSVDARLAGVNQVYTSNQTGRWRLDLPTPGTYIIRVAIGDQGFAHPYQSIRIYDGTTLLTTVTAPNGTGLNQYLDASGVVRTSDTDWAQNEVGIPLTFATTNLNVTIGDTTHASTIAHFRVTSMSAGTPSSASSTGETGIDFRQTAGYVADPTNASSDLGAAYPVTQNGLTFGWTSPNQTSAARNRSASVNARLAGVNQVYANNQTGRWRLDLPAPGAYTIRVAMGDQGFPHAYQSIRVYDGTTLLATVTAPNGTGVNQYMDATGVVRTSDADWVANEVGIPLTFATTELNIAIGDTTHPSTIAHFGFAPIAVVVSSVLVSPVTMTLTPGRTAQLAATPTSASGTVVTGEPVAWTTSNASVATVSATGVVTGVAVGSTTVSATSGGVSGSSSITVSAAAPPPVATGWPNDPYTQNMPGWVLISDYGFTDPLPDGSANGQELGRSFWFNDYAASITSGALAIVSDPTSPVNPSTVLQFTYSNGFQAGVAPATLYYYGPNPGGWYYTGGTSQTYMGFWWKTSTNWQGQSSGVNKLTEFFDNSKAGGSYFYEEYGAGTTPLQTFSVIEDTPGSGAAVAVDYPDNVDATPVTVGQWHQGEILWTYTGPNVGTLKRWCDGKLKASYTNVPMGGTALSSAQIYPDWGGGGQTLTSGTRYQYFAHVRITGRP